MNQIIQEGFNQNKLNVKKSTRKYQLQFFISSIIAIIFLIVLFWKLYQNQQQEEIVKELLNNYQLTTLYYGTQQHKTNKIVVENLFVIGMINIKKINLSYPILFESNDELLKISLCRFNGPMPNETGNLCIAGHNYMDNRFFSRLNELEIGDLIEIYGLSGQKQEYYVFQKYKINANDFSCCSQDVGNDKVVTLLTCDDSDSNRRLVVQAQ